MISLILLLFTTRYVRGPLDSVYEIATIARRQHHETCGFRSLSHDRVALFFEQLFAASLARDVHEVDRSAASEYAAARSATNQSPRPITLREPSRTHRGEETHVTV